LRDIAYGLPKTPWMYTGGLENHPDIVAEISSHHALRGTLPSSLQSIRNWGWVANQPVLRGSVARINKRHDFDTAKQYLRKPIHSGGGRNIRIATLRDHDEPGYVFQERHHGAVTSELYWCEPGRVIPLGRCELLCGEAWLHADGYAYSGNICVPDAECEHLNWMIELNRLAACRGLVGIDCVGSTIVEVNPRYTASVELLELASGMTLARRVEAAPTITHCIGKAIYYAPTEFTVPNAGLWAMHHNRHWDVPEYADIPTAGSVIRRGEPVVTLYASAERTEVVRLLKAKATGLDSLIASQR